MPFKSSERIFNRSGFSRDQIESVDRFLSRPHTRLFTLRNAMDNTDVQQDELTRILMVYIDEGILRKTKRYYCPIHEVSIEVVYWHEGKCVDCGKKYLLKDCETDEVYIRLEEPDNYSDDDVTEPVPTTQQKEAPWWKDRRLYFALIAPAVFLYMHFNPVSNPSPARPDVQGVDAANVTEDTNLIPSATDPSQVVAGVIATQSTTPNMTPSPLSTSTPQDTPNK